MISAPARAWWREHSPLTTYWKPPPKILILRRLSTIPSVYFPPQRLVALETFPNGIAPRSCLLRPDSSWRSGTLGAAPKRVEKSLVSTRQARVPAPHHRHRRQCEVVFAWFLSGSGW